MQNEELGEEENKTKSWEKKKLEAVRSRAGRAQNSMVSSHIGVHHTSNRLCATCAAFSFHLDSSSADYLGMKSSVLGETPVSIECCSVSLQLNLCMSSLSPVLCNGLPLILRLSLDLKRL